MQGLDTQRLDGINFEFNSWVRDSSSQNEFHGIDIKIESCSHVWSAVIKYSITRLEFVSFFIYCDI